jgi:hypothetical protein
MAIVLLEGLGKLKIQWHQQESNPDLQASSIVSQPSTPTRLVQLPAVITESEED